MKYLFLFAFLVVTSSLVNAQPTYKYVIIPTHFNDLGDGLNPHGVCSSLQSQLSERSINVVFEGTEVPDDYCEALTVNLIKVSSMLTNKIKVEFRDCMNRVVWSEEGTGTSKEYRKGYSEAIAAALKDFNQLPVNQSLKKAEKAGVVSEVKNKKPIVKEAVPVDKDSYKPVNPYYNSIYLVDVIESDKNEKQILILNGGLLGYKNHQTIATLSPSGLTGIYTVTWIDTEGGNISGVAKLEGTELEISLKTEPEEQVIVLQKL